MDGIEVVGGLGELLDALFGDQDVGLRRHADVELIKDVAAGRVLRHNLCHGPP